MPLQGPLLTSCLGTAPRTRASCLLWSELKDFWRVFMPTLVWRGCSSSECNLTG